MRPLKLSACVLLLTISCIDRHIRPAEGPKSDAPAASAPPPAASDPAPATPEASVAAGPAAGYSGHGVESVAPEVLVRHAPPRLSDVVSRRIQSMLDVRAPGAGALSPDGKQLFFTWSITGVRQVWRIDGPQRFP